MSGTTRNNVLVKRPTALTKEHDVSQFECGKPALSDWLKKHALQSDRSGHTKSMVITSDGKRVIGYYSFNIVSVEHKETTLPRATKGLAKYSIPIFLIARLAVDQNFQGRKLGKRLMRHALQRAAALSQDVPIRAIVVDAIDDDAKAFYTKFDFEPWPIDSFRMWLMVKDLLKSLQAVAREREQHRQQAAKSAMRE